MSGTQQLLECLPQDFIANGFKGWADIRKFSIETESGCLSLVCHDMEGLRQTIAIQPDASLFGTLAQLLHEPLLRMVTIVTIVEDPITHFKALCDTHGITYIGNGGKIMATSLVRPSSGTDIEQILATIDPAFTAQIEEQPEGCVGVQVKLGDKTVASGQAKVRDNIATFDGIFTEVEFQRRGIATAVMGFLVHWVLDHGASFGFLNASPFGQMLYESLGWTALYDVVHVGSMLTIEFQERMRKKYAR